MARPTKLTPKLQEQIVSYLRAGAYVETAAAAAGIAKDTLYAWLRRGAAGEEPFARFAAAVEEAQAKSELRDLAIIGKAAETEWTAAAWRLERKYPDRYGRRARIEHSGHDRVTIAVTDPARVDEVFRKTFGFEGAKEASGDADARGGVSDVGSEALPVPAPMDRRAE